jgi:membrane-associated protease RseP (regulator of RpoE activity)
VSSNPSYDPFAPVPGVTVTDTPSPPIIAPDAGDSWREWVVPIFLFLMTLITTTFAGLYYVVGDRGFISLAAESIFHPSRLLAALPFSLTLISILLAHEMGHFFACRYYGIHCTPPYFIPFPISIAGTLGAFIRIKSPFHHKRALFDVGVAGPLAGFAVVLPSLFIGVSHSTLIPKGSIPGGYYFGEPLIFSWVGKLVLGYRPGTHDMVAHPVAMAAWFGLLATCLNLLPIWQLDGGHIAYALLGRDSQKRLSIAATVALILTSFLGWPIPSYLVFGLLLLVMGVRFRFFHPPTLYDETKLGSGRGLIGILALLIFIISFTPVPISIS